LLYSHAIPPKTNKIFAGQEVQKFAERPTFRFHAIRILNVFQPSLRGSLRVKIIFFGETEIVSGILVGRAGCEAAKPLGQIGADFGGIG
jgi:hypothetical protein